MNERSFAPARLSKRDRRRAKLRYVRADRPARLRIGAEKIAKVTVMLDNARVAFLVRRAVASFGPALRIGVA